MELAIFLGILFGCLAFFIFANGYNIYKIRKLGKLIRDSGLVVTAHIPVVLVNQQNRQQVYSPSGEPCPPTYDEAQQYPMPTQNPPYPPPPSYK